MINFFKKKMPWSNQNSGFTINYNKSVNYSEKKRFVNQVKHKYFVKSHFFSITNKLVVVIN